MSVFYTFNADEMSVTVDEKGATTLTYMGDVMTYPKGWSPKEIAEHFSGRLWLVSARDVLEALRIIAEKVKEAQE